LAAQLSQTPPGDFLVQYIADANQKILDASIKQISKVNPNTCILLLSHDEAKVYAAAFVSPQGVSKGYLLANGLEMLQRLFLKLVEVERT